MNLSKEQYQEIIIRCSEQIADILSKGESIEINHSRSGIKLCRFRKKHEILKKDPCIIITIGRE